MACNASLRPLQKVEWSFTTTGCSWPAGREGKDSIPYQRFLELFLTHPHCQYGPNEFAKVTLAHWHLSLEVIS
jgi:hypothetical protein